MRKLVMWGLCLALLGPGCSDRRSSVVASDAGKIDAKASEDSGADSGGDLLVDPDSCVDDDECWNDIGDPFFCHFDGCGTEGRGKCRRIPQECPEDCPGVCGCDGVAYCNECSANAAGVAVNPDTSDCDEHCETIDDCPFDEFCFIPKGCKGPGKCRRLNLDCPAIYAPVCGCDGEDYSNECMAHTSGTNVAYEGPCDGTICTSDADCTAGAQWCEGSKCVPCDHSPCDIDCSLGWESYQRNGCSPCACAPANECEKDGDCGPGETCYAGAMCWDWCPEDDPSCCLGNICSAAGCETPPPVGCFVRGCPLGQECVEGCASSGCDCDPGSGWSCDDDCGGGVCQ